MINLIQALTRRLLYVNISNVTPLTSSSNGFKIGGFPLEQIHDLGEVFSIPKKYGKNSSIIFFTFRPSYGVFLCKVSLEEPATLPERTSSQVSILRNFVIDHL